MHLGVGRGYPGCVPLLPLRARRAWLDRGRAPAWARESGLIGASVGVVVYALTSFISMPLFNNLARSFDIQGDLPWDAGGFPGIIVSAFFFLVVNAILYPLFGAISGFITVSLLKPQPKAEA